MSWYPRPIQPFDPVVVSQQPKPPFRYFRDNFVGTGQNSYTAAPAQDPSMWQQLTNVMPIIDGTIRGRWGYAAHTSLAQNYNRLFSFQSDNTGLRAMILAGTQLVYAVDESGQTLNSSVFVPIGGNGGIIRSCTSRNYQYFCDGNIAPVNHRTGDSLKWNGASSGGTTNWGIDGTDIQQNTVSGGGTSGGVIGPNTGTTGSDVAGAYGITWTNLNGAFTNNFATAASATIAQSSPGTKVTDSLKMVQFFSSASGSSVLGIQATFTCKTTLSGTGGIPSRNFTAQLVKNGVLVGTAKTITAFDSQYGSGNAFTISFGSSSDTWGTSFTPNDLIQNNFGIQVYITSSIAISTNTSAQCQISFVQLTATLQGGAGTSTNSGNGVGVVGLVGGGPVNLTVGRQYYLVANNSGTGHFSDISSASGTTGPCAASEANLILATYLDPQVDTKYVLATADGGDPSILYQVQVIAPTGVATASSTSGMNITSWAIAANVVTFTGTYTNGQFKVGATPTVAGLSHGSYMNGSVLTVTGATGTTFTAAFTHGNDSATENGIAGNPTFAISNSTKQVVDITPDPSLVEFQTMLYTDQFGGTFGVVLNDPPPAGTIVQKHQGRLWMSGVIGSTHSVYFSKGIADLTLPNGFIAGIYEESWPASNYFDVSDGAESVAGLLSDGQTLYIGTQNHIRRVTGNDPTNFSLPEIVHPNTGVINQEVWQLIYTEGAPSGAIWMTPDFRVIMSDFNTYVDIGTPIQDILSSIQVNVAPSLCHGVYFANMQYELYILSVPIFQTTYCDYQLVYDLRHRQWYVWNLAVGSRSMLFNITADGIPQWIFLGGINGAITWLLSSAYTQDDASAITVSATTSWLSLGEPTRRKILNEIQVYGNTAMTINVSGANNQADFASPITVANGLTLSQNPFGAWVAYLIDSVCKHKYYRFLFTATNAGNTLLLGSYSIYAQPLEDL